MNLSEDIKPITCLKSRAADLLKQINETHRPVVITENGEPEVDGKMTPRLKPEIILPVLLTNMHE